MTAPAKSYDEVVNKKRAKNRQYNKAFFNRMSDEERKQFFRDRYQKYKESHNRRGREWAKLNREKAQASSHQATVRNKYRHIYNTSEITISTLTTWIKANRGCPCKYCGAEATHIDHIIPLAKDGPHSFDNMQMICKDCNLSKLDRTEEQFLQWIRNILDRNGTNLIQSWSK